MTASASIPHPELLETAARELREHHRAANRMPRPIPVWASLPSMLDWRDRARACCAEPEPESTKAAEWLLDNDYQLQRAVLQVREDLPLEFYRRLPSVTSAVEEGLPRAFSLAHGLLNASRLQLSLPGAVQFLRAYQEDAPLTIAELWAFPTMLRLACLEILVDAFGRLFPALKPPFETTKYTTLLGSFDDTERASRALANLGVIATISWKEFFDRTSRVEALLQGDPAGVYPRTDFDTRDRCRKAVEELAYGSCRSEPEVVESVLAQAGAECATRPHDHVGYWLIGDGRRDVEAMIGYRPSPVAACRRWLLRNAGPVYAAALLITGIAALVLPAFYLAADGTGQLAWTVGIALALLPASVLAVTLVHWIVTLVVSPRVLPKLDFKEGIPPDCSTAVVMPVIVGSPAEVPGLIERMEMHRLRNPDASVQFALLSDHIDAPAEHMPVDIEVEEELVSSIRRLNARYGQNGDGPFHLLHRSRRFNPSEDCWMGWERKRGKLEQFNRFVLGEEPSGFSVTEGNMDALRGIRFVVTADADTTLPPGSVSRLVGTLAHPLNSAYLDQASGRVRAGYTVVQPRVEISPESGTRSLFARLYAGDTAVDIYSRAVSDVYQDLFGEGIYVGKGIYEVASFHQSLKALVPENALVSHDLFEGVYGRAALASDIVLYEDFPAGYVEYARRWHRWVRGDWQLLPWLAVRAPGAGDRRFASGLSALDRWKILDNLRRSLIPVALVALAAGGWLMLPGSPWVWTVLTVAVPSAYLFTDLVTGLARGRRHGALRGILHRFRDHSGRWFLAIVFLLHDAAVALDAIARTLWRIFVSRQHLLEWTSAAHTAAHFAPRGSRADMWRQMWIAPTVSAVFATVLSFMNPAALLPAAPLLLLWVASAEIAVWISRPGRPPQERLGAEERAFLRRLARRTWLYFETFVGPEDNWLPPDNFQEEPHTEIAHRTSPTNVGMMFLSSLTAWDLGYVSSADLAARIRNGLDTLDRLERYRGHFLNWYDTRLLDPLEPRYVSTVDSGNLAVCLMALKEGCVEAASAPVLRREQWDGLTDTLDLLMQAMDVVPDEHTTELRSRMVAIMERALSARDQPQASRTVLNDLCDRDCPELEAMIGRGIALPGVPTAAVLREVHIWLGRMHHHLTGMRRDLETLYPWLALTEAPALGCEDLAQAIGNILAPSMSLSVTSEACARAREMLAAAIAMPQAGETTAPWLSDLNAAVERGARALNELRQGLLDVAARSEAAAFSMDFRLLYDREARLFHVGYNVSSDRIDPHHYDLLATEARLASYFAIAKKDVPTEHWFFLGRPIAHLGDGLSLVSWNGSMFEYLMPPLLLRSGLGTLVDQSERAAVDTQRRYADKLGMPWGISESAFASVDPDHHYHYRAFGVPQLGLRRGLSQDLVVAPYATALALAVRPGAAVRNLKKLNDLGMVGCYGLWEAADFTPERVPEGRSFSLVRAYMAHHQGMILAAIGNALHDDVHVRRFREDRRMRSMELLLQERIPWELPLETVREEERREPASRRTVVPAPHAWVPPTAEVFPQVHLLGNGRLSTWISEAGGGGLWWHRQALTRWLPDATRDHHGLWIYVRDEDSGLIWSVGRQPTGVISEDAHIVFHPHMAEFHRRDHGIGIRMEVGVTAGDDVEIRRITVVNESDRPRTLRLTSCGEIVLAPPLEDERHPAFSKLFVGSEHMPGLNGLLFTRRLRNPRDRAPVLLHRLVSDEVGLDVTGFETDRLVFLGRNGDPRQPRGVTEGLSGTVGWTLDPVMSLQLRLKLEPREKRQFAFLTLAAGSRETLLDLAERYATLASLDWALGNAATEAARETQSLGLEPARLPELQTLASLLIHPHPALRAKPSEIAANRLGQPRLWGFGLSGDLPILLLRADEPSEMGLLRVLIRAHQLWRRRGLHVDLVVLRTGVSGYVEPVRERVLSLLHELGAHELLGRSGGVHLLFADQMSKDEMCLLESVARVVLDESRGPLAQQLATAAEPHPTPPRFEPSGAGMPDQMEPALPRPVNLRFDNGLGGFTEDGREYAIYLGPGEHTPAPWCNVLANDDFGCIVNEAGGGFTWAVNSGESRLTPWTNDPVADPPSEALYLRDEETAEIWTPTPQPAGADAACEIRHGAGYTKWRRRSHGFEQELIVFVPPGDPVKVARLRVHNLRPRARRVTATYYAEWLLGALRSNSRPFVVCEYDPGCHALLARNHWNPDFSERVAFLTSSHPPHSVTADRQDFLGREGNPRNPAGLLRWDLGGHIEPGADPCAAFQVHLDIGAEQTTEVVFVLGQGRDRAHAEELARHWQEPGQVDRAFEELNHHWDRLLGAVRVRTPDPAFDLMLNRWLLYQTLSSRLLARAGFYQAGGAIGFRDQLQDVLALLYADPARARAHILASAARQFEEGDVLHWWHPPHDRGVRTRCSDDLLWLPYVASHYVEATGDLSILSEEVSFLRGAPLSQDEEDRYSRFDSTSERRSLFEHCERALERGVTQGPHGLPFISSGDWNDGMNRVGRRGHGESVWLAWFAIATMTSFAGLATRLGRSDLTQGWTRRAQELRQSVEATAWDGHWYLRAFDDDGRPWGSAASDECRIDSITQSWAVLASDSISERARAAVEAASRELVRDDDRLIRLLWPPFHDTPRDPGYIKAYPPGIRENGGQYTHAAAWLGFAFAGIGDGDSAAHIFELMNPIHHAASRSDAERFRVEPYVIAADVASVAPHTGRGGWTWYTGSAAWTWRLGVEAILGLQLRNGELLIDPVLPKRWGSFEAEIKGPAGALAIRVEDPDHIGRGVVEIVVDGSAIEGATIAFPTDESVRRVEVRLRQPPVSETPVQPAR